MKRTPLAIAGTLAGLTGVLLVGTKASSPAGQTLPVSNPSTSTVTSPASSTPSTVAGPTTSGGGTTIPPVTTTTVGNASATGDLVNFSYGTIAIKVTLSGGKIASITTASLDDGGNPRSGQIDQQAIPMLVSQAMAAQSANIQGVSGASYTSQGFTQSLQSALKKLGR